MSRIVADIIFHLQSQRHGRRCLQFECDFMFLCTLQNNTLQRQAWLLCLEGRGGLCALHDMERKQWNYTREQHVVRTRPPAIKPILQDNYHGFYNVPTAFVPEGKLCGVRRWISLFFFYYLTVKQLPYHSKIVWCCSPVLQSVELAIKRHASVVAY